MYYGPTILSKAGFGDPDSSNSTLVDSLPLAATNALGTLFAVFYMDKLGRRFILLRSLPFVSVSLLILSTGLGLHGWGNSLIQSNY